MTAVLHQIWYYIVLALGLGFVIFFHELGHFLAAKYCDVKVEQFAIGFGPAIFAWRKGIGIRWGSTADEMDRRRKQEKAEIDDPRFGETEYRLNWIFLGGYVKMLGQDDLHPASAQSDPRAYNNKPIRSRMLIISAGVIMNVILAAVAFTLVFLRGYPIPPAIVGEVLSNSPASMAFRADGTRVGLQPGDQLVSFNGSSTVGDFGKILLNVALTPAGKTVPVDVRHTDGAEETLYLAPSHSDDTRGLSQIGITQPSQLAGPESSLKEEWDQINLPELATADARAVAPGEAITQINGQDVTSNDSWKLYRAITESQGKDVDLTIRSADGQISHRSITPHFQHSFSRTDLQLLGMEMRTVVNLIITEKSPAYGKLKPGDIITGVSAGSDQISNPTATRLTETLSAAGENKLPISLSVISPGETQPHNVEDMIPTVWLGDHRGLGISLGYDEQHTVVAQVEDGSPASGKIPAGAVLTAINGKPISNWFEVQKAISDASAGDSLAIDFTSPSSGQKESASIKLAANDIRAAREIMFRDDLQLSPMPGVIHTHNPLKAIALGVVYTRDLILEFYVTLQRMITGDVGVKTVMGPVGLFQSGAQLAARGPTWLLWFLAQISANLAVVNFLPIPIVDGGLFVLLILEKIQGRPLSMETQRIVQMVGLVLILGVFLMVTYQDIARLVGYTN